MKIKPPNNMVQKNAETHLQKPMKPRKFHRKRIKTQSNIKTGAFFKNR